MKYYILHIVTVLYLSLSGCSSGKAFISYGTTPIQANNHLSIGGFIFDTGATYSALFDDSGYELNPSSGSSESVYDANRNKKTQYSYKVDRVELGDIMVENGLFIHVDKSDLPPYMHAFNGLIGMNIINEANWFFDIKNNRATVYPKGHAVPVPHNSFYLAYNTSHTHPETSLKIENVLFRNIRVDFGSFHTIDLNPEDIAKINRSSGNKYFRSDSTVSFSLFQEKITQMLHEYRNLQINEGFLFEALELYENNANRGIRRIGFGFFSFFNYIFVDTSSKKIYLFQ